jgi:riboflavin synthase
MFTGIIETTGIIKNITSSGTNRTFWIASSFSDELIIDQSISHNGVCLTVEKLTRTTQGNGYSRDIIKDQLK